MNKYLVLAAAAVVALGVSAAQPLTTESVVKGDYLVFGQLIPHGQQEIVKHAGLQVIHADGAVTLRGFDPARTYRVTEIDRGAKLHGDFDGVTRTGEQLMKDGLAVELAGEYDSAVLTVNAL